MDFRNYFSIWRVYLTNINFSTYALYKNVEIPFKFIQSVMLLEVVHNLIGLVKSPLFTCVMQYTSHFMLLWGVIAISKEVQSCGGLKVMLLSWCSIETVRYLYYIIHIFTTKIPKILLLLRYNLSFFTIPVGVVGEMWCMIKALKIVRDTKIYSVSLPNEWNFVFNYYYVLLLFIVTFIPVALMQIQAVLHTRAKHIK